MRFLRYVFATFLFGKVGVSDVRTELQSSQCPFENFFYILDKYRFLKYLTFLTNPFDIRRVFARSMY